MVELEKRTSQLKLQNLKLRTATQGLNDLKSKREVVRSSVGDVHSILLHLLDTHDSILTISIRRHLAKKLRPTLDILSRIEGVSEAAILPNKGEKRRNPKEDNEASASNHQKKKKVIGEDDEDEEDDIDDIVTGAPSKPDPKFKPSEQELREKMDRLEKKNEREGTS
uniref:Uncharacterized protein n=1 Tax=Lactuca sativa TaxID=4236 RepID=A0A9R1W8R9_LACSA|nr:hypothetical protein LSAT_V11C300146130 [Lactuca sativa]